MEKTHKIAHLTTVHPPFDVRIFHKECKSIARAGYRVTLVACHNQDELKEGVRIRAIPKIRGRLSRMIRGAWSMYREAVREDADLYHFHDPELLPVGLLLRLRGKLVIYDVHEPLAADLVAKHYIPGIFRYPLAKIIGAFESVSASFLSGVVVANAIRSQSFAVRDHHQAVVNNYPILQEFQSALLSTWDRRSNSVGYIGVLSKDRCLPEIIQAISLVPAELQPTLKVAGAFSPPALQEELEGTDGWERTSVMGVLDRAGVTGLLSNVRAGLVILKPTPAYLETIAVKLFEYMAAGIPVIASDFPKYREIVGGAQCGLLVGSDDPAGVANAIKFILTHPQEAYKMGERGRDAVEKLYNWAGEEQKLLRLYQVLLDSPCAA